MTAPESLSLRIWYGLQRVFAALLLVLLSPVFLLLFVLVRTTSSGPAFYSQVRPGLFGRSIRVWKFRTMQPGSDKDQSKAWGVQNSDPLVTPIGRVLRQLKLEELPQLWNIVRGEMSFVGPRPIARPLYEELCREIQGFEQRLSVRPGLTNVGQVCIEENARQDRVVDDWKLRFESEQHYFHGRSPYYDCVVIGLTGLYILRKVWRALPIPRSSPLRQTST